MGAGLTKNKKGICFMFNLLLNIKRLELIGRELRDH